MELIAWPAYDAAVIAIGSRERSQPPPPHVVFEALMQPDRDPARPWLSVGLLDDEHLPQVLSSEASHAVVWSSLWPERPDAQVRFDIESTGAGGTSLRWTLLVEPPAPEPPMVRHLCKRMNQLINANLRYTFGQ